MLLGSAALLGWVGGCEVNGQIGAADVIEAASTEADATDGTDGSEGPQRASAGPDDADVPETGDDTSSSSDTSESPSRFDVGGGSDATSGTGSGTGLGKNDVSCCVASELPGCPDPELEACVCDADPYCCDMAWDEACADIAVFGPCAGTCDAPPPPMPMDCCVASDGVGCADDAVEACVCAMDPYCCQYTWDEVCVEHIDSYACGMCGA